MWLIYFALSGLSGFRYPRIQGRRASLRYALAPGYHISRLRRCIAVFPTDLKGVNLCHELLGQDINNFGKQIHELSYVDARNKFK
jgi:hypothetical protein